jgi:hypothetical protein
MISTLLAVAVIGLHVNLFLAFAIQALAAIPPAGQVIAIGGVVFAVLQAAKKSPLIGQYITGWVAVALNIVLSGLGVVIAVPATSLYTLGTLQTVLVTILAGSSAAGIHGTYTLLRNQARDRQRLKK